MHIQSAQERASTAKTVKGRCVRQLSSGSTGRSGIQRSLPARRAGNRLWVPLNELVCDGANPVAAYDEAMVVAEIVALRVRSRVEKSIQQIDIRLRYMIPAAVLTLIDETERIRTRIIRMPKTMPLYVSDWPQDADTGTVTGDEKSIPPAL